MSLHFYKANQPTSGASATVSCTEPPPSQANNDRIFAIFESAFSSISKQGFYNLKVQISDVVQGKENNVSAKEMQSKSAGNEWLTDLSINELNRLHEILYAINKQMIFVCGHLKKQNSELLRDAEEPIYDTTFDDIFNNGIPCQIIGKCGAIYLRQDGEEDKVLMSNSQFLNYFMLDPTFNISGFDLSNLDLRGTNLAGRFLHNTTLRGANMSNMSLWGVTFDNSDMRDTDCRGSDFRFATFKGTNTVGMLTEGATNLPKGWKMVGEIEAPLDDKARAELAKDAPNDKDKAFLLAKTYARLSEEGKGDLKYRFRMLRITDKTHDEKATDNYKLSADLGHAEGALEYALRLIPRDPKAALNIDKVREIVSYFNKAVNGGCKRAITQRNKFASTVNEYAKKCEKPNEQIMFHEQAALAGDTWSSKWLAKHWAMLAEKGGNAKVSEVVCRQKAIVHYEEALTGGHDYSEIKYAIALQTCYLKVANKGENANYDLVVMLGHGLSTGDKEKYIKDLQTILKYSSNAIGEERELMRNFLCRTYLLIKNVPELSKLKSDFLEKMKEAVQLNHHSEVSLLIMAVDKGGPDAHFNLFKHYCDEVIKTPQYSANNNPNYQKRNNDLRIILNYSQLAIDNNPKETRKLLVKVSDSLEPDMFKDEMRRHFLKQNFDKVIESFFQKAVDNQEPDAHYELVEYYCEKVIAEPEYRTRNRDLKIILKYSQLAINEQAENTKELLNELHTKLENECFNSVMGPATIRLINEIEVVKMKGPEKLTSDGECLEDGMELKDLPLSTK